MKHIIILSLFTLLFNACSSNEDWDSGSNAQNAFQEQRYQEQVETMRKQVPEARPAF